MEWLHVFFDGFNIYYSLKRKKWQRYMWLDYLALARSLVREDQILAGATFVTARVPGPQESARRQSIYLDALCAVTAPGDVLVMLEGKIEKRPMRCASCKHNWRFLKRVLLITPPGTKAEELAAACDAHLHLTKPQLGRCQLPPVVRVGGRSLERPPGWV